MRTFDLAEARAITNAVFKAVLDREVDAAALRHYSALLVQNEISVREMIRRLSHSDEFLQKCLLSAPPMEAAHGLFWRFLGRSAASDAEAKDLAIRILAHGWKSQIDSMINSGEYLKKFGDDESPSQRALR